MSLPVTHQSGKANRQPGLPFEPTAAAANTVLATLDDDQTAKSPACQKQIRPRQSGGGARGGSSSPHFPHNECLWQIVGLRTNLANLFHIPTHRRSGCAAICAITRETSRYMTHDPRNVTLSAPSRLLMAHEASHFAPKTRERTRANDERTHRIDVRTRPGRERTRVSRRNPTGQDVAALP